MASGYFTWTFNYLNGRQALRGLYSVDEEDARRMAAELSISKGRVIVLNGITYTYGRYGNTNMPTGLKHHEVARYKNGKKI